MGKVSRWLSPSTKHHTFCPAFPVISRRGSRLAGSRGLLICGPPSLRLLLERLALLCLLLLLLPGGTGLGLLLVSLRLRLAVCG